MTDEPAVAATTAITILLVLTLATAAAVGTGLWITRPTGPDWTPQTHFTFSYDGETLTATHAGGDRIDPATLHVHSESLTNSGDPLTATGQYNSTETFTKGDEIRIGAGYYAWTAASESATVRLVWFGEEGDNSGTVAHWEGPAVE